MRVPLHGRRVAGWVVAEEVEPPEGVRLLALGAGRGLGPAPELVELSAWAAWRWAGRRSALLRTASPPRFVYELPATRPDPSAAPSADRKGARPSDGPEPVDPVVATALETGRSVLRLPPAGSRTGLLRAAASLVAMGPGRSVLVLCPSLTDAERAARILRSDGVPVALLPEQWAEAAAGGRVVIGARAAAWGPAPAMQAAIVLDGHDEVYVEERAPTWNAWQVVAERAARAGVPCVVASACPSLEMLEWGRLVTYPRQVERDGWPLVEVVDRRNDDPRAGLLSGRLSDIVRNPEAVPGRPVVCVLNRKGRARLLACRACGEIVRCELCSAAMAQSGAVSSELQCPGCGSVRPSICLSCGATRLSALRKGVARLAEEVAALAGRAVAEVSAERDEGWEETAVVVGTEAALHRVRRATAVVFLDFDQELVAPRYRAAEQALALLARAGRLVGGRGGRGEGGREGAGSSGRVIVQTRLPRHEVLTAAVGADPGQWSDAEAARRRALGLPPFSAMALVSGAGADAVVGSAVGSAPSTLQAATLGDGRHLLRGPDHASLCDALSRARHDAAGAQVRVEVDPLRV